MMRPRVGQAGLFHPSATGRLGRGARCVFAFLALSYVQSAQGQTLCGPPLVWSPCGPAVVVVPAWASPPFFNSASTPLPQSAPQFHDAWRPLAPHCNFAVEITEDFANRLIARCETHAGPVRDFILGADVYGDQITSTQTWLDFRPWEQAARLELVVTGEVESRTVGVTPQAHVQSLGKHQFELRKEIEFDGTVLRTRSPSAAVRPRQVNVAAVTPATGVPLIGPIASSIALQAANARNPQAAAITAERITSRSAPQFNDRVDAELARLNRLLAEQVFPQLQRWDVMPSAQSLATTETSLQWCLTLPSPGGSNGSRLGAAGLEFPRRGTEDVRNEEAALCDADWGGADSRVHGQAATVFLHESLVNGLLDRLPLAGVGIPDAAIDRWFTALAGGAGLAELAHPDGPVEPRLATIVFDEEHPLRLRFDEGRFALVVRMGITPVTGPAIPAQEITVPFTVELTPEAVRFRPAEVTIVPADPNDPGGLIDEAARRVIREQIQGRLEERSAPRRIPLHLPDAPPTALHVRDVTLHRGWLSVALD